MPNITMQEEKSNFSSSQTRSVQVIGGDSSNNVGVGELYIPTNTNSNTMTNQQQSSVSSNVSQNQSIRREQDISNSSSLSDFTFRPLRNLDSSTMLSRMSDFEDVSRDVYHVNDGDTFEMKLEVQDFRPEEIQVKISDNLVTIEGKQEDRKGESNFRSRQFSKRFTIPEGVKAENITCSITTEGQLKISAPIEQPSSHSAVSNRSQNEANSVSSSTVTSKQQQQKSQVSSSTTASRNVQRTENLSRDSSINSDISSLRDSMPRGFEDEFVLRPRMDMGSLMTRKESQFEDISKELCNVNDGKKFEMKLEVKNFKPEEIEVKITKNLVKIDGKHESEFASRSFHKEFTVPFGVKCNSIQCSITEDGILTISAPVQPVHEALASGVSKTQQSVEQEVTSSQKVSSNAVKTQQQVQQQKQTQQQQQTVHSDSNTSISSNVSSLRDAVRRFDDDFMIRPIMDFENMFAKDSRFEDVSQQLCQIQDEKKFEMKLDVPDFKPEELQVKISNNMVTIEGNQKTEFSSKQFFKKFSIPQGVKPESITSSLSPNGVLTISAPIQAQQAINNTSTGVSDSKTTSSTTVEQTRQQSQSVLQQLKQQQSQQQHQAIHSDSNTSINSNLSSIRDEIRRFDDDFMIRPIMDFENLMGRDSRFEDVSKQICQVQDNKKFEMKLDVPDFKPEELQVKISNNMVTIEGNQKTEFSSKQFFKKFSIPQGVKPESITSSLSPKGVLTISAPIQVQQAVSNTSSTSVEQQRQQSQSVMQQLKQQQQQSTQQTQAIHSDSNTSVSSLRDSLRRFDDDFMIRPIMDFENMFAKDARFEDVSKQLCQIQEEKKFEMKLDVPDFRPEELEVKISNNMVTIQGKQEIKGENNSSSRQFFKKFSIPQNVKPETITSSLSPKGVLTISAPFQTQNENQVSSLQQQAVKTASKTSEQEVSSSRVTSVKSQQVQQQSSVESTSSVASSIRDATRQFDEDLLIRPVMDFDALLAKESHFEDISKQLCQVNEGKKFETKLDVPDFKPEELQVKISNNMVTIEGKQKTEFSSKQFFKKFSIPQGVKPESITSSLSPKGVLTISAPIDLQSSNLSNISNQSRNEQVSSSVSSSTTSSSRKEVQQQVSSSTNLRQEVDNSLMSSALNKAISNTRDHIFKPRMNFSDALVATNSQFEDVSKEVCHVNDGKHFEMKLEVQEFKPEEIDVKISNNMVTIEGKQEMREENNFRSRQFCKKFSIPQGVKAENITCSLSTDGRLTISAPVDQSQKQLTSGSDNNSSTVVSQNQQQQQVQQQSGQTSTTSVKKVSSTFSSTSSTSSGQY